MAKGLISKCRKNMGCLALQHARVQWQSKQTENRSKYETTALTSNQDHRVLTNRQISVREVYRQATVTCTNKSEVTQVASPRSLINTTRHRLKKNLITSRESLDSPSRHNPTDAWMRGRCHLIQGTEARRPFPSHALIFTQFWQGSQANPSKYRSLWPVPVQSHLSRHV